MIVFSEEYRTVPVPLEIIKFIVEIRARLIFLLFYHIKDSL